MRCVFGLVGWPQWPGLRGPVVRASDSHHGGPGLGPEGQGVCMGVLVILWTSCRQPVMGCGWGWEWCWLVGGCRWHMVGFFQAGWCLAWCVQGTWRLPAVGWLWQWAPAAGVLVRLPRGVECGRWSGVPLGNAQPFPRGQGLSAGSCKSWVRGQ